MASNSLPFFSPAQKITNPKAGLPAALNQQPDFVFFGAAGGAESSRRFHAATILPGIVRERKSFSTAETE
jgi:hypothetical protein